MNINTEYVNYLRLTGEIEKLQERWFGGLSKSIPDEAKESICNYINRELDELVEKSKVDISDYCTYLIHSGFETQMILRMLGLIKIYESVSKDEIKQLISSIGIALTDSLANTAIGDYEQRQIYAESSWKIVYADWIKQKYKFRIYNAGNYLYNVIEGASAFSYFKTITVMDIISKLIIIPGLYEMSDSDKEYFVRKLYRNNDFDLIDWNDKHIPKIASKCHREVEAATREYENGLSYFKYADYVLLGESNGNKVASKRKFKSRLIHGKVQELENCLAENPDKIALLSPEYYNKAEFWHGDISELDGYYEKAKKNGWLSMIK